MEYKKNIGCLKRLWKKNKSDSTADCDQPNRKKVGKKMIALISSLSLIAVMFLCYFIIWWTCPAVGYLKTTNPKTTSLIENRKHQRKIRQPFPALSLSWVQIQNIPKRLQDVIVVAEDGSFFRHVGVDWYEVKEALFQNLERGKIVRGASTITQQLAKNLFLSESRSWLRKLREWVISAKLEEHLTKSRILELYLNCIEFGPGIFGIGRASHVYFGMHPSQLSLGQIIRLVSVIPLPLRLNPNNPSKNLEKRSRTILHRLFMYHLISESSVVSTTKELDAFFGHTSPDSLDFSSPDNLEIELIDEIIDNDTPPDQPNEDQPGKPSADTQTREVEPQKMEIPNTDIPNAEEAQGETADLDAPEEETHQSNVTRDDSSTIPDN